MRNVWTVALVVVLLGGCGGGDGAVGGRGDGGGGGGGNEAGTHPGSDGARGDGGDGEDAGDAAAGESCTVTPNANCSDGDLTSSLPVGVKTSGSPTMFPVLGLRGYGCVSGTSWALSASGGAASVLRIDTQNASNAELTLAKYESDLASMGGVSAVTLGGNAGFHVSGQGYELVFASGSSVIVVTAMTESDIVAIAGAIEACSPRAFTSTTTVPMFLDRWDKYAFNVNYSTFWNEDADYDYLTDFQFASQHGIGFAVYPRYNPGEAAEGFMDDALEPWVIPGAAKYGMPVVSLLQALAYSLPSWVGNRYAGTGIPEFMPGYHGSFLEVGGRSTEGGSSTPVPWGGGAVEDEILGEVEGWVRDYATAPNVVAIQEPHEEMQWSNYNGHILFSQYGPAADMTFQAWLQSASGGGYASPGAVGTAWYGDASKFNAWTDIHVPELSSFAGHDATSVDLTGPWKYSTTQTIPASAGGAMPSWAATTFDDSTWESVPFDDHMLYIQQTGNVAWRTHFTATSSTQWLYIWDLAISNTDNLGVNAWVDGQALKSCIGSSGHYTCQTGSPMSLYTQHWAAFQLPLTSGAHTLALSIPATAGGEIGYQAYLSATGPNQYPNLASTEENQRWYDYATWFGWTRQTSVASGMGMIRQVSPNPIIDLASPGAVVDLLKESAEAYGGDFHNTGSMAGSWADVLPSLMRSSGLPFSAESGSQAPDAASFMRYIGLWLTEGVNAVNYVSNITSITGIPDVQTAFEALAPVLAKLGKYHVPGSKVAQLYSGINQRVLGFPWYNRDPSVSLLTGDLWMLSELGLVTQASSDYPGGPIVGAFDIDAVTEADFSAGNAAQYSVIIDSNTTLMSSATVSAIQDWVEAGGTFVTYGQTGRHSPNQANSWPIATLTGYDVTSVDPYTYGANAALHPISEVSGQTLVKSGELNGQLAVGLHMKSNTAGTQDAFRWADGSTAIGTRTLGKGRVVTLGATFSSGIAGGPGNNGATLSVARQIFAGALAPRIPGVVTAATKGGAPSTSILMRHFVSNNGLYDVWVLYNQDSVTGDPPTIVTLSIDQPSLPTMAINVNNPTANPTVTTAGGSAQIAGISLAPGAVQMFLTPRNALADAPVQWFGLQRGWWRGTAPPPAKPFPTAPHRYTIDLHTKFPLNIGGTGTGWSQTFTVPSTWTGGQKELWVSSGSLGAFRSDSSGSASLDGKAVLDTSEEFVDVTTQLTPGSHTFQVSASSANTVFGVAGEAWVRFVPDPAGSLSLTNLEWASSTDGIAYSSATASLPISFNGLLSARTTFTLDSSAAYENDVAMLAFTKNTQCVGALTQAIVNGHWSCVNYNNSDATTRINVTPYLNWTPGAENTVEIINASTTPTACPTSPPQGLNAASLDFYAPGGIYP